MAIGGVGGSGTRLVAEILRDLGFYIGDDLNISVDNLWFTLLFKRADLWPVERNLESFERSVEIFRAVMADRAPLARSQVKWIEELTRNARPDHDTAWLRARAESLIASASDESSRRRSEHWGWKEPNTHIFLDRLAAAFPRMKYVHVMRNGLDMAYSSNQAQLRLWGHALLTTSDDEVTPRGSLRYWRAAHRRVIAIGQSMGDRFLLVNFDELCREPAKGLEAIVRFIGESVGPQKLEALERLVRPPESQGRFKKLSLDVFDPADVAYVESLGFDVRVS